MLRSLLLPHVSTDATWREIERLLDEVADLADAGLTAEQFYAQALERTVQALAADGAALWNSDESDALRCLARTERDSHGAHAWEESHCESATVAWQRNDAHVIETSAACLLYAPVRCDDQRVAMIEVDLPAQVSPEVQESALHVLRAVCELAGDDHRRRLVRELQQRLEKQQQWRDFLVTLQADLGLDATAYCLANEGRLLVGCDTLSVLVCHAKRCRAVAVSGVDVLERRARKVRALESLAAACARRKQPVWWPRDPDDLAPQLREPLEAYLDESHARQMAVVPIVEPGGDDPRVIAVLVAEDASARLHSDQFRADTRDLAELSANALVQAVRLRRIPLSRWLLSARRTSRKPGRRWSRAALVVVAALVLFSTLVFVPAPLRVRAHGTLQPKLRRHVFAPEDAIVDEVLAKHGQAVRAGQPLLQLSKPELLLETTRTLGDLQVAQQQLQSVRARRFVPRTGSSDGTQSATDELAAEEQRLQQQVDALNRLLTLLHQREDTLRVCSPIDGQVLTWDTKQLLAARPVQKGQNLLTVADPEGPWILELRVDDRDAQHMLDARRRDSALHVSFCLGTNPGVTYEGRVNEIARRSELAEGDSPTVKVVVGFDAVRVTPLRAGSEVVARVDCGKRSLGYVWLRDVWDAIRLRLFF